MQPLLISILANTLKNILGCQPQEQGAFVEQIQNGEEVRQAVVGTGFQVCGRDLEERVDWALDIPPAPWVALGKFLNSSEPQCHIHSI